MGNCLRAASLDAAAAAAAVPSQRKRSVPNRPTASEATEDSAYTLSTVMIPVTAATVETCVTAGTSSMIGTIAAVETSATVETIATVETTIAAPQQSSIPNVKEMGDNRQGPLLTESAIAAITAHSSPEPCLPSDRNFSASVNTKNGWEIGHVYDLGEELGRGAFGAVYAGSHRFASPLQNRLHGTEDTPEWKLVAIKQTRPNALDLQSGREMVSSEDLEERCQEIKVLLRLQEGSPKTSRVLFFYEFFKSMGNDVYLVTELLGQELDEWKSQCDKFTERMAIDICRTILQSIVFCSSRGVIHRDIKLQNVLFRVNGDFRTLKLVDFGLARVITDDEAVRDFCGSIGYIAPEIYAEKSYRFEVDMFAFGVLLFRMLSGVRPFPSNDDRILKRDTMELRYSVQGTDWVGVSSAAKNLVRKLLINRQERYTAEQALSHPWFSEVGASVLRPDLSCALDRPDRVRSKAFLLSQGPTTASRSDGTRFWIDSSFQMALATIISQNLYSGQVVEDSELASPSMICIQEVESPIVCPITLYICRLRNYTELDVRAIARPLAQCIQKLHNAGIAHRNLHTGNIIIDPFGTVSLRGLQYSQPIRENKPLTGHFGGAGYAWYAFKAPEVDRDFVHDKSVDLWSLGAIFYVLLTGVAPFRGNGMDLVVAKHSGRFDFDVVEPSTNAQRLIRGLLQVDPRDRFSIEDVLNHDWMVDDDNCLETFELSCAFEGLKYWV